MFDVFEETKKDSIIERDNHYTDYFTSFWKESLQSKPAISHIIDKYYERISDPSKEIFHKFLLFDFFSKKYHLPQALTFIKDVVKEASELLSYEDNWDDEGAKATDETTFKYGIDFLITYSRYIYINSSKIIGSPLVEIMKDGSVYLQWESKKGKLLIIFKKGVNNLAYLYGEDKVNKIPFKSAILIGKPVDEIIALWMQKNLA